MAAATNGVIQISVRRKGKNKVVNKQTNDHSGDSEGNHHGSSLVNGDYEQEFARM